MKKGIMVLMVLGLVFTISACCCCMKGKKQCPMSGEKAATSETAK